MPETIFSRIEWPAPNRVRTAAGLPGPDYWQQKVDYTIDATLDDGADTIRATETVTYTNNSPDPLPYLWIHLEQNRFRPDSLGARSVPEGTRFGPRVDDDHGFRIISVSVDGRPAKLAVYDTVGRLDLPSPVAARGGRVTYRIEFSFVIPEYGADRFAIQQVSAGRIFQLAQWFPAAAVYDDVFGWNTLPYLGQGEFYTNFGDYEVSITVPRSHIVGATGVLTNPESVLTGAQMDRVREARATTRTTVIRGASELGADSRPAGDGLLTWRFSAKNCRTFAWASSPAFLWDASGIDWKDGTGVLCQSMYPAEAMPLWGEKATDMLRFSIEHYSEKWHRYPYPTAINVNGRVGGMEYPCVIYCAERHDERGLYGVTTHEIGHNWFPMLVSNDERRHAWMDEGFNSFINYYAVQARYPDARGMRGEARAFVPVMLEGDQQPMETPADRVLPGRLGSLEYQKTAVGMVLLRERILGPERFDPAFREYISAWAFKSPRPWDFFRAMENGAGMDLSWFWRGWFYGTGVLDQAVAGVAEEEGAQRVLFENRAELVMPLEYRLRFSDGHTEDRSAPAEVWAYSNRWADRVSTEHGRVVEVVVDPNEAFPDAAPANNVWRAPG